MTVTTEERIDILKDLLADAERDGNISNQYCDGLRHAIELMETGEIK